MHDIQEFDSLQIKLASPEKIRAWSYGEVKKPETINYRTLRPEKDGLFCERIFGTTKEWECYCGKFKSIRYRGVICDRCGVEVTHSRVRRERMGHIELASPVSHIWYYRATPSSMGSLLSLTQSSLRSILYYEKYIVIEPGNTELVKNQLLSEEEYSDARERYGMSFSAGIGAEAISQMLESLDLDSLTAELRSIMISKGAKTDRKLLKRIEIVDSFRKSDNDTRWMILNCISIIPPDLRPMVLLDGGHFATSDLNDLYRRVINRNNRLRRLMSLNAPDVIIRNEKRMLQEAVDALFDNSKRKKAVKGASSRPLKSLSDLLKGKQGRFRQNLLGKRVDYSGRSVVVVGPKLKLYQCGLPVKMALELFKPFIMRKLTERNIVYNIKKAKTLVEQETNEVWQILDEVIREHPVLLNRAPTLHRLGIQGFEPVPIEGKAIQLHPLVCHAFNADFDGDQMAVHVPLTQAAQIEVWNLMLASKNLMNPANGQSIVFPSQDMVLGIYNLTKPKKGVLGDNKHFSSHEEVLHALSANLLDYHANIRVLEYDAEDNASWLETTAGRVAFNVELPRFIPYVNETLDDKKIRRLVESVFENIGVASAVDLLDSLKDIGFRYATLLGSTIGVDDILIPAEKKDMIDEANSNVNQIQEQYLSGHITNEERYNRVVEVWGKTNEELTKVMMDKLENDDDGFNNIYIMADSGARGSRNQIRQLAGMRGLMAKPSGDIIELPIRSNFKEGLSVIEFFISTNGARKGLADTALKTADAGYLTRRLVDISQDVVVNEYDCGTINGIDVMALKDGEEIVESLADRIRGSYTLERVKHPITNDVIINVDEELTDNIANKIEEIGIESVRVRTVQTCEAKHGVCCKCYGRDLTSRKTVNIGEAVGIIAAQSIGQPGTQLTMRTFHVGGTASTIAEDNKISLHYDVLIKSISGNHLLQDNGELLFTRKSSISVARVLKQFVLGPKDKALIKDGEKVLAGMPIIKRNAEKIIAEDIAFVSIHKKVLLLITQEQKLDVRNGSTVRVKEGDIVKADQPIAIFDPFSEPIIAEQTGKIKFVDIINGVTLREELNEDTGNIEKKIAESHSDTLEPRIIIQDKNATDLATYFLPNNVYLNIEDDVDVIAGQTLAKLLKESTKTHDITGGLPRVVELFEARQPRVAAVLSKITGTVHFLGTVKGKRVIAVRDKFGREFKHLIPSGRHLLVRNGDPVEVAEPLSDGMINPHNILEIQGENALQRFLMDEIQEVYSMQGVNVNDKHIGVIVRQMMRKVDIIDVGDTRFIFGQQVDKYSFHNENEKVVKAGGKPAIAKPLLLGITRASLNIDSWVSAASFQETTRVLTSAAIAGDHDRLHGLKENVVIGHIIPAGTGMRQYRNLHLFSDEQEDLDAYTNEIAEQKRLEKERNDLLAADNDKKEDIGSFYQPNKKANALEEEDEVDHLEYGPIFESEDIDESNDYSSEDTNALDTNLENDEL